MRTSVVPAQITTVEDKLAANLTITQLLILTLPIIADGIIIACLPSFMHVSVYKLVLIILIDPVCCSLAIRVKGELVIHWAINMIRFNLRPGYYVFDKNDPYLRSWHEPLIDEIQPLVVKAKDTTKLETRSLNDLEILNLNEAIKSPKLGLRFVFNAKEGIDVRIKQVD